MTEDKTLRIVEMFASKWDFRYPSISLIIAQKHGTRTSIRLFSGIGAMLANQLLGME